MKKCKCCLKTISLLGGDYCDECYKRLPLQKKFVEDLERQHFFKSCATNRHFLNSPSVSANAENIISVKRKSYRFPKSASPTSFNLDIKRNFGFCS